MLSNKDFCFKQFAISQERCAMKVGTDGVLLGAWVNVHNVKNILDLGTGTALLALMLAQRVKNCKISAVEIDEGAFLQARENIQRSPWAEKINIYHQDIADFTQKCGEKFDLIVANPPYFSKGVACSSLAREQARYIQSYSHLDWLNMAESCLAPKGRICFVLPYLTGEILQKQTALYCVERCDVTTKSGKQPQRMLLTFSKIFQPIKKTNLTIYNEQNQYSKDFVALTKDFYLKF
ncbi:tRNA1(Val) (adenine(37)-N6)-methyltransferase [Seminibacterium arietis]|uniref:tRNA1(Val) (adenine(37)-N6)-methyltransferase n=1 Tax=Seminibacterium arietis TaxID=1173502 RepID=A0ABW3I865_9PAST